MKKRHHRMIKLSLGLVSMSVGLAIFFSIFKESMVFYHTPSEIYSKKIPLNQEVRIGGFVKKGSLHKGHPNHFVLEDNHHEIPVKHNGILPTLFKENTTAVVMGCFKEGDIFHAKEVLAKHDEVYHPPRLKEQTQK